MNTTIWSQAAQIRNAGFIAVAGRLMSLYRENRALKKAVRLMPGATTRDELMLIIVDLQKKVRF